MMVNCASAAVPQKSRMPKARAVIRTLRRKDARRRSTRLRTLGRDMIGSPDEFGERGGVSPPILRQAGLRYHGKTIAPGAQTEHRGGAGLVRDLLGGGHAPAAWIFF